MSVPQVSRNFHPFVSPGWSFSNIVRCAVLLVFGGLAPVPARAQIALPAAQSSVPGPPAISVDDLPRSLPTFDRVLLPRVAPLPSVDLREAGHKLGKKFGKKYDISRIGYRGVGKGINLYSLTKEQALGKELSLEVESSSKLLSDPVITEYINRLGQQIVRNSDAQVPFTIKVVDNDEVNAFALPGGFFYVNSGLIMAADSEAELAGVMAHEIAHVAARHATKNATKGEIWNIASIPLIFVGGPAGYAVRQVAGLAVPMSFLKFSRDAEREADLLGIEYQYATGYDPAAFIQFFEKIKLQDKKKSNFLAKAFQTHPMTEDRIKRAQQEIEVLLPPKEQYVVDTSEFQEVKSRLAALVNRSRFESQNLSRPTLHRRGPESSGTSTDGEKKDDERPTLKRRTN